MIAPVATAPLCHARMVISLPAMLRFASRSLSRSPDGSTTLPPRHGMTLIEAAVVVLLLGIVLFLLAGTARWTRQQAKDRLAWRMLAALDASLQIYYDQQGAYPPGRADLGADDALALLLADPNASKPLAALPRALHATSAAKTSTLLDPWARRLRYLAAPHDQTGRVAANAGRPVFLLADDRGSDEAPPQARPPTPASNEGAPP